MAWIVGLTLAGVMLPLGCAASLDKPIVTYERDAVLVPKMSEAPKKGLYTLFPGNGQTPLSAIYLQSGDKFGFQNINGKVVGVYMKAGKTNFVELDGVLTSEYIWKYEGDKQP